MKVEEAITKRRTVYTKHFVPGKVERGIIEKMISLANWAPTHRYTEPWRFQVHTSKAKNRLLDKLLEIYIKSTSAEKFNPKVFEKYEERKRTVAAIITIGMQRDKGESVPEWEEEASVAMAVQNMWLYLSSIDNVGGYWSTPAMCFTEEFANFLDLGEGEKSMGIFYLGKTSLDSKALVGKRSKWEEKTQWKT